MGFKCATKLIVFSKNLMEMMINQGWHLPIDRIIWIFFKNKNSDFSVSETLCYFCRLNLVGKAARDQNRDMTKTTLRQPYLVCCGKQTVHTELQKVLNKRIRQRKILLQAKITLSNPCTVYFATKKGRQRRNISKMRTPPPINVCEENQLSIFSPRWAAD